jgi:hypothetical protein
MKKIGVNPKLLHIYSADWCVANLVYRRLFVFLHKLKVANIYWGHFK